MTLTFKQPMLWTGPLTKMGPGVFARGGTYEPRFQTDDNNDPSVYPADASNTWFNVRGGAVTALATNAYNGVSLRFSEGGALLVDAATTDEALKKYGIVNTKIADPFVSVVEGGMVSVEIDYGDMPAALLPSSGKKVAICTVKDAEASAALRQKFSILPLSGVNAELSTEAADGIDGAYTVYATLSCKVPTVTENCSMDARKLTLELDIADACGADKLTVALKQGDVVKGMVDVTPLAVGLREVVFDGLSAGDYTYQIKLSGTYKGEDFIREEEPVSVTLATPATVTPQDSKLELSANAEVDMANTVAGSYAVSSATGKKCHLRWTDANGKYAVMSEGTLEVMEGRPENGLDSYLSYVLGLDADTASSKPHLAAVQGSGESQDKITFTFPGLNPLSESETGVTLSYKLFVSSDPTVFSTSDPVAASTTPELSADLPTDKDAPVRYYKAQIDF